jgi:hypothetical protein
VNFRAIGPKARGQNRGWRLAFLQVEYPVRTNLLFMCQLPDTEQDSPLHTRPSAARNLQFYGLSKILNSGNWRAKSRVGTLTLVVAKGRHGNRSRLTEPEGKLGWSRGPPFLHFSVRASTCLCSVTDSLLINSVSKTVRLWLWFGSSTVSRLGDASPTACVLDCVSLFVCL